MVFYEYNKELNCFRLKFNDIYIVDAEQLVILLNLNKRLNVDCKDIYPYYFSNGKQINILQILYTLKSDNLEYIFHNNNHLDLRTCNVTLYHKYHKIVQSKYSILKYIPGHYSETGTDAYIMKNPMWLTNAGNYIMYCEKSVLCILCEKGLEMIRLYEKKHNIKITFHCHKDSGYISGGGGELYIHQILMDFHGHGKGTKNNSIDHINRNPHDNRLCNLRIVSNNVQQSNKVGVIFGTKKARSKSAQPLPDGLTQDMMPKYIVYYKECYNKEKKLYREFFKIEKHPKCEKPVCGSKSSKFTWQEKLEKIKEQLNNIDNDIKVENPNKLPTYYRIGNFRKSPHLIYEKRIDGKRLSLSMKLKENVDVDIELQRFNEKLYKKYPELE
tara:strand:- start:93 stop:1247 length:1155 start_codon:yes stop_codon:yes gene_type:complete